MSNFCIPLSFFLKFYFQIIVNRELYFSLCRNGHEQRVLTPIMKIVNMNNEGSPPQSPSGARQGSSVFLKNAHGC